MASFLLAVPSKTVAEFCSSADLRFQSRDSKLGFAQHSNQFEKREVSVAEISHTRQAGGQMGDSGFQKESEVRSLRGSDVRLERLVLASKSPRRAEILRAVGWPFEPQTAGIDETRNPEEDAITYVTRLAREKARAVAEKLSSGLVLGADTVVVAEGEILGQPKDIEDARRMLRLLSGKWHDVWTGVALVRAESGATVTGKETTRVRFSELTEDEIDWYATSDEPRDKAGAYAVQGVAALFIEEIQGEYFNIMGLPIRLVYELSRKI
jgi:septum formation protein